jgi:hypothetical protein
MSLKKRISSKRLARSSDEEWTTLTTLGGNADVQEEK